MTDLPEGMVSAEAHMKDILYANAMNDPVYVILKRDAQWREALAVESQRVAELEADARDHLDWYLSNFTAYRRTIDEQCAPDEMHCACVPHLRQHIADLKHQLGEYADKLDCMVDPEEHRQKLAASQAECAELKEAALSYIESWNNLNVPGDEGDVRLMRLHETAMRTTGTQDALRAVCEKVANEAAMEVDEMGDECWTFNPKDCVARVLGGSHAASE